MRVLITGAGGFIGSNLAVRFNELGGFEVLSFHRGETIARLESAVKFADAIVHLAAENRPTDETAFDRVNNQLTRALCDAVAASGRKIPIIFTSSIQAERDNPYGVSKRAAEEALADLYARTGNPVVIFRLPGVFGKWCRPNYNSVVATFCHKIANDLPVQVHDPDAEVSLVYIDDVTQALIGAISAPREGFSWGEVQTPYRVTVGELERQIRAFNNCRTSLISERVGSGFLRALYATYVSYLPPERFTYDLVSHDDERGIFVEMLKTQDSGQFSFFTIHPGLTRGSHYHHTKTEKFLTLQGTVRVRFRQLISDETYEIVVSGAKHRVIDSIPGWIHDITNIGDCKAIVMLWASEIFDYEHPDSIPCEI